MKLLKPREAFDYLAQHTDAVLVDVRSEIEYMFVGHPTGAVHIPWIDGPNWELNPHFVPQVRKVAHAERPVVLICRSGVRSVEAAKALEEAGWHTVCSIAHGFEGDLDDQHHRNAVNGWRFEGLPWGQT
ncbi:MAG: rhodanese-like domain-containing protein [Ferrovum sp.]|nr:rhodanese-like domain-containing protein [Ferrovum sp.]NDU88148.1 rhodanese-like domain-containing protein [Ferrovum sp.]